MVIDQQKMLLRGFYSGGPTSNRGYPLRGVGPHGPSAFCCRNPNSSADCSDHTERALRAPTRWHDALGVLDGRPLSHCRGGRGAVFVDASDSRRTPAAQRPLRFNVPHLSPGLGLRYRDALWDPYGWTWLIASPTPRRSASARSAPKHGSPSGEADENFLNSYWLPLSLYFAIGEAFDGGAPASSALRWLGRWPPASRCWRCSSGASGVGALVPSRLAGGSSLRGAHRGRVPVRSVSRATSRSTASRSSRPRASSLRKCTSRIPGSRRAAGQGAARASSIRSRW